MMIHFWMAVASREHVLRAITGGFAQVCHGKPLPLKRMKENDWIIYYSPTEQFGKSLPCRLFTAIGQVEEGEPYPFQMSEDFIPWRRNVKFLKGQETAIEPLISELSFIQDKKRWGFPFRRGCFSIPEQDFKLIATKMGIKIE